MAQNYVLLETIELSQSASAVTFDNLPTTGYTDLKIVTSLRGTVNLGSGYVDGILTFNGITTGYTERMVYGLNSSNGAQSQSVTGFRWGNWSNDTSTPSNTFGNAETYIANYRSSTYKSVSISGVQESNASTNAISCLNFGVWANTSAITSITFTSASGSFAANSTLSLYGIAALNTTPVTAPFATGGNIVANDGTYWYHAFLNSGTFTPLKALSCDVLVVAGGGAGGGSAGGGGGAGGILGFTAQALASNISQNVVVGAGGTGSNNANGTVGIASQFALLTAAAGGGYGGGGITNTPANRAGGNGAAGGGGGGSGDDGSGTASGGTGTSPGYAGGTSGASPSGGNRCGGGGGGFGTAGSNVVASNTGGNGGAGVNTVSNFSSLSTALTATSLGVSGYLAGGGGGGSRETSWGGGTSGTGGSGGGGLGDASTRNGTAGTSNTGSGGGGGHYGVTTGQSSGYNGGSGVVIVRYLMA